MDFRGSIPRVVSSPESERRASELETLTGEIVQPGLKILEDLSKRITSANPYPLKGGGDPFGDPSLEPSLREKSRASDTRAIIATRQELFFIAWRIAELQERIDAEVPRTVEGQAEQ